MLFRNSNRLFYISYNKGYNYVHVFESTEK